MIIVLITIVKLFVFWLVMDFRTIIIEVMIITCNVITRMQHYIMHIQ